HGTDLKGGTSEKSCFRCHSGQKGPEECNTCHGDFTKTINADSLFYYTAPPKGVFGESATSTRAVGAHRVHLLGGTISGSTKCQECHLVPTTTYQAGHVDSQLPAEVLFKDSLANTRTGNIIPNPSWDSNNLTCQNTYCHGNFEFLKANSSYQFVYTADKMTGLNKTVKWTKVDGTEAACGSCHGLPPAGHLVVPLSSCGNPGLCHAGIVDSNGKIIDKKKHINGKIN
ncbi:MAG: CxxxxCH/CxxCH domain-containing protein, partial [Ignavibacteria bacterium]|nr:CxxxxCH/CxxCH domain-containing protein [Ignavibacteria bacterium]